MTAAFWSSARAAMMLDPTVINLNTGSFGPLPRVVFEHVTELRRRLAAEPMDFLIRQTPPLLWQARERLAALVGAASAPPGLHGERDGVGQHRRHVAATGRAGRNPAERPRIRRDALVLGARRPASRPYAAHVSSAAAAALACGDRGRGDSGVHGADTRAVLQSRPVADRPGGCRRANYVPRPGDAAS